MKKIILGLILVILIIFPSISIVRAQTDDDTEQASVTRDQALQLLADAYKSDSDEGDANQFKGITDVSSIYNFGSQKLSDIKYYIFKPHSDAATIFIVLCLIFLLPQGILTICWMAYAWNDPEKEVGKSPREYYEPHYTFTTLLPARHEEAVIKDTIYAVNAINYPDELKEILILIRDENDDGTIAKAKEAIQELGNPRIRLVTFTDGPKNKPNGLNHGLKVASHDIVCVFDAEDEPHPDIFNVVNTVMLRDQADVVQAGVQLMNYDTNWFSALNCLEYFFWFKSGLHLFTRWLNVTPLGGNTVFFRRDFLERVDGWDDQLLTEDADLGIRMVLEGAKIRIVYDAEHVTQEETPENIDQFIKQRTRWSQGFFEIFFKMDWWRLPQLRQKIGSIYILLNPIIQASMMLYLPLGIFVAFTQEVVHALAMASYIPFGILIIELMITLAGIKEFSATYEKPLPKYFLLKVMLVYYPFQIMLAAASFRACYRFIRKHSAWEKTAHNNVHRTSVKAVRSAAD